MSGWDNRVLWDALPADIRAAVEASGVTQKGKAGNLVLAERKRCAALVRAKRTVVDDVGVARQEIAEAIENGEQP